MRWASVNRKNVWFRRHEGNHVLDDSSHEASRVISGDDVAVGSAGNFTKKRSWNRIRELAPSCGADGVLGGDHDSGPTVESRSGLQAGAGEGVQRRGFDCVSGHHAAGAGAV